MKNSSFILKVSDASKADVRKALKAAGIQVRAITEVYSEKIGEEHGGEKDKQE